MYSNQRYFMVAARALVAAIFMMNALDITGQTPAAHEMAAHGAPPGLIPLLIMTARAFGSGILIDPAGTSHARYLGYQGDLEIRWAPVRHTIIAFNVAGFQPKTFFKTVTYNAAPVAANIGFTYRF